MLKQLTILSALGLSVIPVAHADCLGAVIMGKCHDTETSTSSGSSYQGSSGAQYQYDLSNPVERNRYSIDTDAQNRDRLAISPSSIMDRSRGQFGGGFLGD